MSHRRHRHGKHVSFVAVKAESKAQRRRLKAEKAKAASVHQKAASITGNHRRPSTTEIVP